MGTHDLRLRLALTAQREGRQDEAAALYAQVLQGNPYLVEAWWGLSQTTADPEHALYCVKRVLAIAPHHTEAIQRLKQLALEVTSDTIEPDRDFRSARTRLDRPLFF